MRTLMATKPTAMAPRMLFRPIPVNALPVASVGSQRTNLPKQSRRVRSVSRKRGSRFGRVQDVSVIIPACNESKTLRATLRHLHSWKAVKEIIVVANGCTDDTVKVAERHQAKVISFSEMLGHDTGRAVGARHATGKFLLFLDGDIVWHASELRPFIDALRKGADIALNRYPRPVSRFYHHPTAVAKRALNVILNRRDLQAASMTSVPHAIRRSVLSIIDSASLAVPPVAHARAAMAGLRMVAAHFVNVHAQNRWTRRYPQCYATRDVIIGDHLQAVNEVIHHLGIRAGFGDYNRKRALIEKIHEDASWADKRDVAAVIPAKNEAKTLKQVLKELRRAKVKHVCVVENGSSDKTAEIAIDNGAQVQQYEHAVGHDVGRAIGLKQLTNTKCTLILDADFRIRSRDLKPFEDSVLCNDTDVALNDLSSGLRPLQKCDAVSTMKAFLNIAMGRRDLGLCSLTAIPHALSARALELIPVEDFAVPPKALVRAHLAGLEIQPVHYVDVIRPNRWRKRSHGKRTGGKVTKLIVGDHVEALALLLSSTGERGGYVQPRRMDVLSSRED